MSLSEEVLARCIKITDKLIASPCAQFFRFPVDPVADGVPDYFKVVRHPMDLTLVRTRLEDGFYCRVSEWLRDVELIWSNAEAFNGPDNVVTMFAQTMRAKFEKFCLSLNGDCASWLAKIDSLSKKLDKITAEPPPALKGKLKPRKTDAEAGEKRKICMAADKIKDKNDLMRVFQVLRSNGVYVGMDNDEAFVELSDVTPFARRNIATVMKECLGRQFTK